jgi:hypothetical protein
VPAFPKPSAFSDTESPPLPQAPAEGEKSHEEDGREYFVSELVYIHDKLLIVDDRIVLVGSGKITSFIYKHIYIYGDDNHY